MFLKYWKKIPVEVGHGYIMVSWNVNLMISALRKEKREKIVSSKRLRLDASHNANGEHGFTEDSVSFFIFVS